MFACYRNIFKGPKTHLELANHISEGNLFPSTFKVRGNKVPSDFQNFASKCQFYDYLHFSPWLPGRLGLSLQPVLPQKGPRPTMGIKANNPHLPPSLSSYLAAVYSIKLRIWLRKNHSLLPFPPHFSPLLYLSYALPCPHSSLIMLIEQVGVTINQNLQQQKIGYHHRQWSHKRSWPKSKDLDEHNIFCRILSLPAYTIHWQ